MVELNEMRVEILIGLVRRGKLKIEDIRDNNYKTEVKNRLE